LRARCLAVDDEHAYVASDDANGIAKVPLPKD
jgi:hypothetical protein